jgi:CubicO group peptidase (beta-lactamase class C family)
MEEHKKMRHVARSVTFKIHDAWIPLIAALLMLSIDAAAISNAAPISQAPTGLSPDINVENWYWGPGNRWSYKNTRRIFPSADIYRGDGPVAQLAYAPRNIDDITFVHPTTKAVTTVAQMFAQTDTDAFLVMKDGKILTERYFNGMNPADTHLLMSVTKSVVGSLAGIIIEQGRLRPTALITDYVPELKGSAYAGATVRQLLDMTVGLDFNEDYASKTSDLYRLDEAAGWVPRGPNAPRGLHEYLATLTKRVGVHGSAFRYISANVDLMGWVMERATNTDFANLLSQELWSKLGAERDAYVLLDGHQAAYSDAGLNATLRDVGRFAQMMLQNGVYNGNRIVPEAWIQDIRQGGDPKAWKASPAYPEFKQMSGYDQGSYRSYWYVADPKRGHYAAIGLAGQLIVIDPRSNTVIVKFSSESAPDSDKPQIEYTAAIAIIDALAGRSAGSGK